MKVVCKTLILCYALMLTEIVFSQNKTFEEFSSNEAADLANDLNYIFASQGFGNRVLDGKKYTLEPLWFEAQITPNFFIRFSKNFGLTVSPKVVIKMFNKYSAPVNSPSYMPNITAIYMLKFPFLYGKKIFNQGIEETDKTFLTLRICHYSNGQEGSFYFPNTNEINFNYGSFSTNYLEFAFNWARKESKEKIRRIEDLVYGKLEYEQHFNLGRDENLSEIYYYNKISLQTQTNFFKILKLIVKPSVMFGKGSFTTKFSGEISLSLRFCNKSDFSFFVRGYYGPDYYNLRYVNTMLNFSFGILADPIGTPLF